MKVNGVTNWIAFDHKAKSLFHVIASGNFVQITAGKEKWKSLIDNSALQDHCNKEGFNVNGNGNQKLRIGIMANNEGNCDSCDSFIGFGTSIQGCLSLKTTSCGNIVVCSLFNSRETPAFGYILVQ